MKIMITGCKGQLGNELQTIIRNNRSEIGAVPEDIVGAEVIPVDIEDLDITDASAVLKFVGSVAPDVIINCAAMTNVDGCETNYETAFRVNAAGVRNLACAAESIGA